MKTNGIQAIMSTLREAANIVDVANRIRDEYRGFALSKGWGAQEIDVSYDFETASFILMASVKVPVVDKQIRTKFIVCPPNKPEVSGGTPERREITPPAPIV